MAKVQVVYCGPYDEVCVPAFGLDAVHPGEPLLVDQEQADVLVLQDTWCLYVPPAPAPKPKP